MLDHEHEPDAPDLGEDEDAPETSIDEDPPKLDLWARQGGDDVLLGWRWGGH